MCDQHFSNKFYLVDRRHFNFHLQSNFKRNYSCINYESFVYAQSMEVSHTGLFVPVDKTTLLLGTASPSLQSLCNVRAVIGPTQQQDKCCEILLLPIPSSHNSCRENYEQAKTILKNYLSLLVKENVVNNDKKLGQPVDSNKNVCNKSMNVTNHKLMSDDTKGKLQHGVINRDKHKVCVNDLMDRSVEILDDSTVITVKNKGSLLPSKYPSIQSPTVSNTDDVEIVDLVRELPSSSQSKGVNEDSRLANPFHVVFGSKEKPDFESRRVTFKDYCQPVKESDEEDEVLCVMNSQDVVNIGLVKKDSVSGSCDTRPIGVVPDSDKEDIVVLSEDDSSQKSDLSDSRKIFNRRGKKRRNRRKKKKSLTFGMKYSSNNLSGNNNVEGDSSNESCGSPVVEKDDNVDKIMENIENTLKCLSGMDNVIPSNIVNKDVTIEDDDLSVIEIDTSVHDEIILISENEEDSDVEDDVKNNKNDCTSQSFNPPIINATQNKKKQGKRKKKKMNCTKAELSKLSRDELIKRGFVIDPQVKVKTNNFVNNLHSLFGRNQENRLGNVEITSVKPSGSDTASSEALYNCNRNNAIPNTSSVLRPNLIWSRPAHLNFLPVPNTSTSCIPVTSNASYGNATSLTGPPLIVKNISTDATLSRKRKAPSQIPNDDCSPSKRSNIDDKIGSNVCIPDGDVSVDSTKKTGLRPVIIDASNVAFSHGRNEDFSAKGIEICVRYFKSRGHRVIAILPNYRKAYIANELLHQWEKDGTLAFTPSRKVNGQLVVSHDDRYIIQVAAALGGVIVSQDHYRDFIGKNSIWDEAIKKRLLMFMWVGDLLMFPEDPLGRNGPTLNDFLRFPSSSNTTTGSLSSR